MKKLVLTFVFFVTLIFTSLPFIKDFYVEKERKENYKKLVSE